jgi:hypothetical protein
MGPRLLPCNVTHSPPCMPPPPKIKKAQVHMGGKSGDSTGKTSTQRGMQEQAGQGGERT